MKSECDHHWASPFKHSFPGEYRYCLRCGLEQSGKVKITWTDKGINKHLIRIKETIVKPHTFNKSDPYSGWNEGLGMYITSKSHYDEVVKEQGLTPIP